jgi:hypothetical protein
MPTPMAADGSVVHFNVGLWGKSPPAAHGRLPTDAILRPLAAYRRIAAGQAKKVTGAAE